MDWITKYAPKSLEEVMGNSEVKTACMEYIKNPENMPHLLFYGHTGTGKTTVAKILVKELLGDNWKSNYKEMNASDDRGIDAVRDEIIKYMKYAPLDRSLPFKILILDEADAMTPPAQECLKTPLEKYKHNCRVIIICNRIEGIIREIKEGRCTTFAFSRLSDEDIIAELQKAVITGDNEMNEIEKIIKSYID